MDAIDGMLSNARKHVAQIGFWVGAIELGSPDQSIDRLGTFTAGIGTEEEKILSPQRNHAVILPISGKKLKFITAGIPFMVDAYACSTVSSVLTVASCMLRSNLVL